MKNGNDKEDVTKAMLGEAVDAILEGMNKMVGGLRTEMKSGFDAVDSRFDKVDERLERVETEVFHVKDEINGLKAELSDTPSRREFKELKTRVEKNYPLS